MGDTVDLAYRSRVELQGQLVAGKVRNAEKDLEEAVNHLLNVTLSSSRAISHEVVVGRRAYGDAVRQMSDRDPGVLDALNDLAARCNNYGSLEIGATGEVVQDKTMVRAKVVRKVNEDTYVVSLWTEHYTLRQKYEEGFDTPSRKTVTLPRSAIFTSQKQLQSVTVADPKAPRCLVSLYSVADRTRPLLLVLGQDVERVLSSKGVTVKAITPPLKNMARSMIKTLEKYKGDYRYMTDLCRMTFECADLKGALSVLELLEASAEFRIVLVKNRLMLEYDASPMGGSDGICFLFVVTHFSQE